MPSDTESSPPRSTAFPVDDQWLLVAVLALGAVLIDSSLVTLVRFPVTLASFIRATPDTWIPLAVVVTLIGGACVLEYLGRPARAERFAWLAGSAIGLAGVVWYFRAGHVDWLATPDWIKEWTYYTALRESLDRGGLPWFLNEPFQDTTLFFANAETVVAPHAVLLQWLDVPTFVVVQAAGLAAIGLLAAYHLARDLRLGPVASLAFLSIFLMNGHVIAHLETGHGQWVSYFLLTAVLLFVHRAAMGNLGSRTQAGLAMTMALTALVGGWHVFVWCVIFAGIFVAIDRSRWRFGASVAILLAGLTAIRLVPAALLYDAADRDFVGSYRSLSTLAGAFIGEPRRVTDGLNWWEYNLFVGWVGFVIVLTGLAAPLSRVWRHTVSHLWAPSVAMLLLSCFNVYEWTLFNLPGFNSQRVASRLLVVGVIGFTLIASVQLNLWLSRHARSRRRMAVLACAAVLLAAQLVAHLNSRRPRPDRGIGAPAVNVVSAAQPGPDYRWSVAGGGTVTLVSFGMAALLWHRRAQSGGGPR